MILRKSTYTSIVTALERSRVVALLGPRQCGKTTLARQFVPADSASYFDLEDPLSLARLDEPMTALRPLGTCGDRRSAAAAGAVPHFASPCRQNPVACPFFHSGQRRARSPSPVIGVTGWPDGNRPAERIHHHGRGNASSSGSLAAGRLPAFIPGNER